MIVKSLLEKYGAVRFHLPKASILFSEGEVALFYYQIIMGEVKMVNFGEGKEFVKGIFSDGQSFGEPPFLIGKHYPASAMVTKETTSGDVVAPVLNNSCANISTCTGPLLRP